MSDHMTASGSAELSDSVAHSLKDYIDSYVMLQYNNRKSCTSDLAIAVL